MRSMRVCVVISLVSMALVGLAPGCAMEAPPDEQDEERGPGAEEASDGLATPDPDTSSANSYGEWCHAWCWNNVVYAGADVTKNCASWADMVCRHRNTSLYDAYWCLPNACRVDVILY